MEVNHHKDSTTPSSSLTSTTKLSSPPLKPKSPRNSHQQLLNKSQSIGNNSLIIDRPVLSNHKVRHSVDMNNNINKNPLQPFSQQTSSHPPEEFAVQTPQFPRGNLVSPHLQHGSQPDSPVILVDNLNPSTQKQQDDNNDNDEWYLPEPMISPGGTRRHVRNSEGVISISFANSPGKEVKMLEDELLEADVEALPLNEKLKSNVWKVRLQVYEEIIRNLQATNAFENKSETNQYSFAFVNFMKDPHALVQEKALEAFKLYSRRSSANLNALPEILQAFIEKGIAAGRPQTRNLCIDIMCQLYEKSNTKSHVQDAIQTVVWQRNPKVAWASIQAFLGILEGSIVEDIEEFEEVFKYMEKLVESTVMSQKEKALDFYKKVYKKTGGDVRKYIRRLKKKQAEELEKWIDQEENIQQRTGGYINTNTTVEDEQRTNISVSAKRRNFGSGDHRVNMSLSLTQRELDCPEPPKVVSFDKYDENWCQKVMKEPKWEQRRKMLEDLLNEAGKIQTNSGEMLNRAKSIGGDSDMESLSPRKAAMITAKNVNKKPLPSVGEHLVTLLKTLLNDNNLQVMLVTIKLFNVFSMKLQKNFSNACRDAVPLLLSKLKDKKPLLVQEVTQALNNITNCLNSDELVDDLNNCLSDKSPILKNNILTWLQSFLRISVGLSKKSTNLLESLLPTLKKLTEDADPEVRELSISTLARYLAHNPQKQDSLMGISLVKLSKIRDLADHFVSQNGPAKIASARNYTTNTTNSRIKSSPRSSTLEENYKSVGSKPGPNLSLKVSPRNHKDFSRPKSMKLSPAKSPPTNSHKPRKSDTSPRAFNNFVDSDYVDSDSIKNAYRSLDRSGKYLNFTPVRGSKTETSRSSSFFLSPPQPNHGNDDSAGLIKVVDLSKLIQNHVRKLNTTNDWKIRNDIIETIERIFRDNLGEITYAEQCVSMLDIDEEGENDENKKENIDSDALGRLTSNRRLSAAGLQELITSLRNRLNDSNKSQVRNFLPFIGKLAVYMGSGIKVFAKALIGDMVKNLSDKQQAVRQETIRALDHLAREVGSELILNFMLPLLDNDSPEMRIEVLEWTLKNSEGLYKAEVRQNVGPLLSALQDRTKEIRSLADLVLSRCVEVIGTRPYLAVIDSMKPVPRSMVRPYVLKYETGEEEKRSKSANRSQETTTSGWASNRERKSKTPTRSEGRSSPMLKKQTSLDNQRLSNIGKMSPENSNSNNSSTMRSPSHFKKSAGKDQSSFSPILTSPNKSKIVYFPSVESPRRNNEVNQHQSYNTLDRSLIDNNTSTMLQPSGLIKRLGMKDIRAEEAIGYSWTDLDKREEAEEKIRYDIKDNINPELYEKMYAEDLKTNIQAVQALKKLLIIEFVGTVDILDIILRWLFVKVSEKTTIVRSPSGQDLSALLAKEVLDYLLGLVLSLEAADYKLLDFEAEALLQCLVEEISVEHYSLKITVHKILQKFTQIYHPSQILKLLIPFMRCEENLRIRTQAFKILLELVKITGSEIFTDKHDVEILKGLLVNSDFEVQKAVWQALSELTEDMKLNKSFIKNEDDEEKPSRKVSFYNEKSAKDDEDDDDFEENERKSYIATTTQEQDDAGEEKVFVEEAKEEEDGDYHNVLEEEQETQEEIERRKIKEMERKVVKEKFIRCMELLKQGGISAKLEALLHLQDLISWETEVKQDLLKTEGDNLVKELGMILASIYGKSSPEVPSKFMLYYLALIQKLCSIKPFLINIQENALEVLCSEIWKRLVIEGTDKDPESPQANDSKLLVKTLTPLVLKLLDNANPNAMFSIIYRSLNNDNIASDDPKLLQLITTCLLKMVKTLPQYLEILKPANLLLTIHLFLQDYEPPEYAQNNVLKATQTLVSELTRHYKNQIWDFYMETVDPHPRTDQYIEEWILAQIGPKQVQQQQHAQSRSMNLISKNVEDVQEVDEELEGRLSGRDTPESDRRQRFCKTEETIGEINIINQSKETESPLYTQEDSSGSRIMTQSSHTSHKGSPNNVRTSTSNVTRNIWVQGVMNNASRSFNSGSKVMSSLRSNGKIGNINTLNNDLRRNSASINNTLATPSQKSNNSGGRNLDISDNHNMSAVYSLKTMESPKRADGMNMFSANKYSSVSRSSMIKSPEIQQQQPVSPSRARQSVKETQQGFKSPTSTNKLSQSQTQPSFKKYNSFNPEEKRLTSSSINHKPTSTVNSEKKPNYGRSQTDKVQESTISGLSKSSVIIPKATPMSMKKNDGVGRSSVNQKSSNEAKLRDEEIEAKKALKSLEQKLTILKSRVKMTK